MSSLSTLNELESGDVPVPAMDEMHLDFVNTQNRHTSTPIPSTKKPINGENWVS